MVTSNNPDAKNVLLIIKLFQPLSTCCGWKPRFDIHFSDTSNAKVPLHDTSANKWLIFLGLIKSSNQRPHLRRESKNQVSQYFFSAKIHQITKHAITDTFHHTEPSSEVHKKN